HELSIAHDPDLWMVTGDPVARRAFRGGNRNHRVIGLDLHIHLGIKRLGKLSSQLPPGKVRVGMESRQFALTSFDRTMIDGDSGAIGSAIGHADQHGPQMRAEFRPEFRIFQEKTDNSTHDDAVLSWTSK